MGRWTLVEMCWDNSQGGRFGPAATPFRILSFVVFAYGATGAGKTHTMLGREGEPGIMYLTTMELYRRLEARQEEKQFEVLISYLEVGLLPIWPTSYFILRTPEGWSGEEVPGNRCSPVRDHVKRKPKPVFLLLSFDIACKVPLQG